MNYSTAVFLINKNIRAVHATYEADDNAKREVFKTLDQTIAVGDFVIVPTDTRHKMTVCKIVDTDVDVDFDSSTPIKWLVGKVDQAAYAQVLAQEAEAITAIKSAEIRQKREDLAAKLLKDNAGLKALPIAGASSDPKALPDAQ